ncbi:MAG: ATP-binding protein [Elusimicrobia bacterium]|nr:ATP-binding protein [Elusimicrobiota bacterium]
MWEPSPDTFKLMVESATNAVLIADEAGRILWANAQTERLFAYGPGEMLGREVEELIPARFRAEHPAHRARFHAAPSTRPMGVGRDLFGLTKNGHEVPVEIGLNPIRAEDGRPMIVAVITDITERRRREEELRLAREELARKAEELEGLVTKRTESLRQVIDDLETFCYTMTHDLRAPLRAMQGYAFFVLDRIGGQVDEQTRNQLERLSQAAERMDILVKDLLAYSRLTRGDAPAVPVDLDEAVAHVLRRHPGLGAAGVEIQAPLGRASGQAALVVEIVSHLVGNAVKFVPPERTPAIRIWTERAGGRLILCVSDNGIGIPCEHIPKLFRPFVRLHSATARAGTGIGLAIVKKAAERMGGRAGVESELGKGSRFWVELPAA